MDSSLHHLPNDTYVSRMPVAPRIQLLPPTSTSSGLVRPCFNISCPAFLQDMDLTSCLNASTSLATNWSYDLRHQSQDILPFLYLGPIASAKDLGFLKAKGISLILTLRHAKPSDSKPLPAFLASARTLSIDTPVLDVLSNQSLISVFPAATRIINGHLDCCNSDRHPARPAEIVGSVLVCCDSGNDRSAATVIAYVMETFGLSLLQAHRLVQNQRFCVATDDSMRQTLQSYEDILRARGDLGRSSTSSVSVSNQRQLDRPGTGVHPRFQIQASKRSREVDCDMGVDEADDMERFEGRGFSPFQN